MALPGIDAIQFIRGFLELEVQLQPAGVDLTVAEVHEFTGVGLIGFNEKSLASTRPLEPIGGEWMLRPGAYKIVYGEEVRVPEDCLGLCLPRSTLLRCGATLYTAVWDPGYHGRGEGLLQVMNPYGVRLKVRARIGQLVFIKLTRRPHRLYLGSYQGEHLDRRRQM